MPITNELKIIGAIGTLLIAVAAVAIRLTASSVHPLPWWLLATALWLYCIRQFWRRRALNRPHATAPAYPDLGWANRLTLLRGGLIALAGGFFLQPIGAGWLAWLPGLLYATAAAFDRLDGMVARRSGRLSLLGQEVDTVMDALGLLVAPLLAVGYGKLHWSFLAVSAAYYLFVTGLRWRRRRQLPAYPLPPSALRRALAGFQMGFVALVLLPIFGAPATRLLGAAFALPILAGFVMDWLAVSGRINLHSLFRNYLTRVGDPFFQPGLRLLLAVLIGYGMAADISVLPLPAGFAHITLASLALCFFLGLGARLAAGVLLIAVSLGPAGETVVWPTAVLLFAAGWVLLLGGGRYSLWRGDDIWVNRHA